MKTMNVGYRLLRPLFFRQDPENAHRLTLHLLRVGHHLGLGACDTIPQFPVTAMGLHFPNPVGLAAGMDKNGEYIDALGSLGFGYLEVGTVTPRAQLGNPRPRLFRLAKDQAIINRMGFNNHGVDVLIQNIQKSRYQGILGINIGKNSDTPIERAQEDYLHCFRKVYPYASYITVNISSPNTKNLRDLQESNQLDQLLTALKKEQGMLAQRFEKTVPLVLKIAPDLVEETINSIAQLLLHHQVEGVITTNTTLARENLLDSLHHAEVGGLSGAPLTKQANHIQQQLAYLLEGKVCIFGSGGVMSGQDAVDKLCLGASLVQLYSGMVYQGPALIEECITQIADFRKQGTVKAQQG